MTESSKVDLSLQDTKASFAGGWHKLSYSKMAQYRRCQASWFFENYAVPLTRDVYSEDSSSAIPGTIIQRVWEAVINERIYRAFQTPQELAAWMGQQSRALFQLIVFPMQFQFELPRAQIRGYFRAPTGQQRILDAQNQLGLHPSFSKGLQPKFTDLAEFAKKHKSLDQFFAKLEKQYLVMLLKFMEQGTNFDNMLSEQFIQAHLGEYIIAGGMDFIYNPNNKKPGTVLTKLHDVEPGYLILDGKNQIGETVSATQLFVYGTMMYLNYRKLPSYVGFIDWSKSDFVWYQFSLDHVSQTKKAIQSMQLHAYKIKEALNREAQDFSKKTISIYDVPHVQFSPSRINCMFCGLSNVCKHALATNNSRIKPSDYIPEQKAVISPEDQELFKSSESEIGM